MNSEYKGVKNSIQQTFIQQGRGHFVRDSKCPTRVLVGRLDLTLGFRVSFCAAIVQPDIDNVAS